MSLAFLAAWKSSRKMCLCPGSHAYWPCDLGKLVSFRQVFVLSSVKWGDCDICFTERVRNNTPKHTKPSAPRVMSTVPTDQEICGIRSSTVIRQSSAKPGCDLYSLWPPQRGHLAQPRGSMWCQGLEGNARVVGGHPGEGPEGAWEEPSSCHSCQIVPHASALEILLNYRGVQNEQVCPFLLWPGSLW